jgi:hypothetical protein
MMVQGKAQIENRNIYIYIYACMYKYTWEIAFKQCAVQARASSRHILATRRIDFYLLLKAQTHVQKHMFKDTDTS